MSNPDPQAPKTDRVVDKVVEREKNMVKREVANDLRRMEYGFLNKLLRLIGLRR